MYKTTNGGLTWRNVSSGLNSPWINGLAIDQTNSRTLYAGTDGSVAKSTDGGRHWTDTALTNVVIESVSVDELAPSTVYAGGHGHIFKSTNGGTTWSRTEMPANFVVFGLAISPRDPSTVCAATNAYGAVLRSTDRGDTWQSMGPDAVLFAIAFDPSVPNTAYAAGTGGVYKSDNGCASWRNVLPEPVPAYSLAIDPSGDTVSAAGHFGVSTSTNGGLDWARLGQIRRGWAQLPVFAVALDPQTPTNLYVGTLGDWGWGLFRSSDGGGTWELTPLTSSPVTALAIDQVAPQVVYAGTEGGGLFSSTDRGLSWGRADAGLPMRASDAAPLVFSLATDPAVALTVYAGTQDGVFKSVDGGRSWYAAKSGLPVGMLVNTLVIHPRLPSTLYAAQDDAIRGN